MFEGAALSWPLPDIVIRRKGGFANRETQGCQVGGGQARRNTKTHHDRPTRRNGNCRDRTARTDDELTRPGGDCHQLIQLV
jgi:hypothetical protein